MAFTLEKRLRVEIIGFASNLCNSDRSIIVITFIRGHSNVPTHLSTAISSRHSLTKLHVLFANLI